MNSKVEILRKTKDGGMLKITADCSTSQEIEELISTCKKYVPRAKIFGVI